MCTRYIPTQVQYAPTQVCTNIKSNDLENGKKMHYREEQKLNYWPIRLIKDLSEGGRGRDEKTAEQRKRLKRRKSNTRSTLGRIIRKQKTQTDDVRTGQRHRKKDISRKWQWRRQDSSIGGTSSFFKQTVLTSKKVRRKCFKLCRLGRIFLDLKLLFIPLQLLTGFGRIRGRLPFLPPRSYANEN